MSIQTTIESVKTATGALVPADLVQSDLPRALRLQKSHLAEGVSLSELLVLGGLATNRDDARRLIASEAVRIEGRVIDNAMERVRLTEGALRLTAAGDQILLQAV